MKLKLRPTDFRVLEVLRDGYVSSRGDHRVYRVTKRKLTSPQAAGILAAAAGVEVGQVSMAGLKDRQGVTIQYMSVPGGKRVELVEPDLRIEPVGSADRPIESMDSAGNAFEINVRAVSKLELHALRRNLDVVRECGVPNYFDDQRFGNLRYHQGWVARDLMVGRAEDALRRLLCAQSEREDQDDAHFKSAMDAAWGDWERCWSIAKRHGQHRSLFEHLREYPNDFPGAFRFIASRIRLIHLYAWQSHLYNRALAERLRSLVPVDERVVLSCIEGALPCPATAWPRELDETLALPGAGLADVSGADEFALFRDLLAEEGLSPGQHRIEGIDGFGLKAERRDVRVIPRHLRVRPAEPDRENRGFNMVRLRFELPRGAYASLVVKRLLATATGERAEETAAYEVANRRPGFDPSQRPRDSERRDERRPERRDEPRGYGGDERGIRRTPEGHRGPDERQGRGRPYEDRGDARGGFDRSRGASDRSDRGQGGSSARDERGGYQDRSQPDRGQQDRGRSERSGYEPGAYERGSFDRAAQDRGQRPASPQRSEGRSFGHAHEQRGARFERPRGDRPSRERDSGFHDRANEPRPANAPTYPDDRRGSFGRSNRRENWRPSGGGQGDRRQGDQRDNRGRHWNSAPPGGASVQRDNRGSFQGGGRPSNERRDEGRFDGPRQGGGQGGGQRGGAHTGGGSRGGYQGGGERRGPAGASPQRDRDQRDSRPGAQRSKSYRPDQRERGPDRPRQPRRDDDRPNHSTGHDRS